MLTKLGNNGQTSANKRVHCHHVELNNGSQQWSRDVTLVGSFAHLISVKVQFNDLMMFKYSNKLNKKLQI